MIAKLVTLKLIIFLLLFPFITYGMKRKREDESAQPSASRSSLVPIKASLTIQLQNNTSPVTKNKLPKKLIKILQAINKAIQKNSYPFTCIYKDCKHKQVYTTWKGLRAHLISKHAPQYMCKQCKKIFPSASLSNAQTFKDCPKIKKHNIIRYLWTQARQQEFLSGINNFNIDQQDIQDINNFSKPQDMQDIIPYNLNS